MQNSYTKNFLYIYIWQVVSILLGFVSLFVVIPYLSADKAVYGIYTVCLSVTIFLAYADLGFLSAGQKYAAEAYAKGEINKEREYLGFSGFILSLIVFLIMAIVLYLSYSPSVLIKELRIEEQKIIASRLLLILALFSPVVVFQRLLSMIYGIRLKEYVFQRINIIGSLFKICSVFIFFSNDKYDIVSYFFFFQVINLVVVFAGILVAKLKFHYDFMHLLQCLKFSKLIFLQSKSLAFSSLFVTFTWILYYELDSFVIGKSLGVNAVAIYAIGLTVLGFFRSIYGVLFSPFSVRFNHFVGQKQIVELRSFYLHVVFMTFPLVVFPIIVLEMLSYPFVISWVGDEYISSVEVMRWLVICNLLAFVSYPCGALLISLKRLRSMYWINILLPLIYWLGIVFTINLWGIKSFAVFKSVAFLLVSILYFYISCRFLKITLWAFLKKCIFPYIPALIVLVAFLLFFQNEFITSKSKLDLLYNGTVAFFGVAISIVISYFSIWEFRKYVNKVVIVIFKK